MTMTYESIDSQIRSRLQGKRHEYVAAIKLDELAVDINCQQPYSPTKVAAMQRRGFDWALVSTITVSARSDGTKVVIDGQTRRGCAMNVGVTHLPGIVWYDLLPQDESWLFRHLNEKSNPAAIHKFRNDVNAGEPWANGIINVLYKFGWDLSENGATGDGRFVAVTTAGRIYNRAKEFRAKHMSGPDLFDQTIRVATMAWGHKRETVDNQIISGLAAFLAKYEDRVDYELLIRKLGAYTPIQVRAEGRRAKEYGGLTPALGQASYFHTLYNKGLRNGKLPPFVPK